MTQRRGAATEGQEGVRAPTTLSGVVTLLSAFAVVVAAALLIIWVVVDGDSALVYAAMGFAVASIVLLWAAKRVGRGSDPTPDREVALGDAKAHRSEPNPTAPSLRRRAADPSMVFPIGDYDSLWVSQIIPLLAGLDLDELTAVEERERGGRHRTSILGAIAAARPTAAVAGPPTPAGEGKLDEPEFDDEDPLWSREVVSADTVGATAAPADLRMAEDREPFDWTGAEVPPVDITPDAGDDAGLWTDEDPAPDVAEPVDEPEGWDWAGDVGWPPVPGVEAADDMVDASGSVDGPVPPSTADATPGSPRVRTFLGRRRSPVTVRRR